MERVNLHRSRISSLGAKRSERRFSYASMKPVIQVLATSHLPMGYDVKDRKLVINNGEAKTVRKVFERFVEIGSATVLAREFRTDGVTSKQGKPISKG